MGIESRCRVEKRRQSVLNGVSMLSQYRLIQGNVTEAVDGLVPAPVLSDRTNNRAYGGDAHTPMARGSSESPLGAITRHAAMPVSALSSSMSCMPGVDTPLAQCTRGRYYSVYDI